MKNLKGKANRTIGKGNPFNDIELVLRSARKCFEQYGVERTRLADVAKLAGISRPLLYKLFDGREGLLDASINFELQRLIQHQQIKMKKQSGFKEVLYEGIISGIQLARKDKVLMELLEHSAAEHISSFLLDQSTVAHQLVLSHWKAFFEESRKNGELKAEISNDDLMEWIMIIQHNFLLRTNIEGKRIRELLDLFFYPTLDPFYTYKKS